MINRAPIRRLLKRSLTGLLVVAFALRAIVPLGFMPSGAPFTVSLCPADFPIELLGASSRHEHADHKHMQMGAASRDHAQHAPSHDDHPQSVDHCPFGFAPAAAPAPHIAGPIVSLSAAALDLPVESSVSLAFKRDYHPPPRGPPKA